VAPEPTTLEEHELVWPQLKRTIESKLGKIVAATIVGSRRYNLQMEGSDFDYYVM